jgi:glycogen debranching enzyme
LKRYGAEVALVHLATGLFDAVCHFPSLRMPELFCGFARSAFGEPVRYPVACSPQAWAAASLSLVLQAVLGIRSDAPARELPPWLEWVRIEHMRVGEGEVDFRYERVGDRTAVDVLAMRGGVRVTFVDSWPG